MDEKEIERIKTCVLKTVKVNLNVGLKAAGLNPKPSAESVDVEAKTAAQRTAVDKVVNDANHAFKSPVASVQDGPGAVKRVVPNVPDKLVNAYISKQENANKSEAAIRKEIKENAQTDFKNASQGITLDKKTHTYYYNGKPIGESVSDLLDGFQIVDPYKKRGTETVEAKIAAKEGEALHKFAEKYFSNRKIDEKKLKGKELAAKKFFDTLPPNLIPVAVEVKLRHPKSDFAGTIDLLLYDMDRNGYVIVDFKTNKELHRNYSGKNLAAPFQDMSDTPYNRHQLQLSAYEMLMEANGFPVVGRRIIHVRDTGVFEVLPTGFFKKDIEDYLKRQKELKSIAYKPLTNASDTISLLQYKRNQQRVLSRRVKQLDREIGKLYKLEEPPPHVIQRREELEAMRKAYHKELTGINNDVAGLSKDDAAHEYVVIQKDLARIEEALAKGGLYDAYLIQNKLTFYKNFLANAKPVEPIKNTVKIVHSQEYIDIENKNKVINRANKALEEIKKALPGLEEKLTAKNREKILELLINDADIQEETLVALNADLVAKKRFGKPLLGEPKSADKETAADYEDFTTADLLTAVRDITKWDKNFLGVQSSNRGDTVLPKYLSKIFDQYLSANYAEAAEMVDELNQLNNENRKLDKSVLHSKFADGTPDGGLTDAFTNAWYEFRKEFVKLAKAFSNAPFQKADAKFEEAIQWLRENAEMIDFFKLPEVREVYYYDSSKEKYFKYSEAEMKAYQKQLMEKLGPQYDIIIDQLLDRLLSYELYRKSPEASTYGIAAGNLWEFNERYFSGAVKAAEFETPYTRAYKDEVVEETALFNKMNALTFIPKRGEHYSEDFKKIKNSEPLSKFWKIYVAMSQHIDSRYGSEAQDKRRILLPKVPNSFADEFKKRGWKNLSGQGLGVLKEVVAAIMTNNPSVVNNQGIISNNKDDSKYRIRDKAKMLIAQGMEAKEAIEKATKEVLATYYGDVEDAYRILLTSSAGQKAREDIEPMMEALFNVYQNIKGVQIIDGKEKNTLTRERAIARMREYINSVIRNNPNAGENEKQGRLTEGGFGRVLSYLALVVLNAPGKGLSYLSGGKWGYEIEKDDVKFILRQYSEQEKNVLEELKKLKIYAAGSEDIEINDTVGGVKYVISARYDHNIGGLAYSTNVVFEPYSNTVKRNTSGLIEVGHERLVSKEQFEKARDAYFIEKANSYGEDVTWGSLFNGFLSFLATAGLAISPKGGIFNRLEGVMANTIADASGEYWETGADVKSKEALAFANLNTLSVTTIKMLLANNRFLSRKIIEKHRLIMTIKTVFGEIGAIEERSRTNRMTQSNLETGFSFQKLIDFAAINAPEFKNKGQVALNVMQDTYIQDDFGEKHKFFDGDLKEFAAFTMDDSGKLVLRDNFKKFRWDSPVVTAMTSRIIKAVNSIQGNYSDHDVMMVKKNFLGRAFMLFFTWLPEHLQQAYGITHPKKGEIIVDLSNNQRKRSGYLVNAWRRSKASLFIYLGSSMFGIPTGGFGWILRAMQLGALWFVPSAIIGGLVAPIAITSVMALAAVLFVKAIASRINVKKENESLLLMGMFLEETLKGTWNNNVKYLSSGLPGKNTASLLTINKRMFKKEEAKAIATNYLTEEEIGSIKAMAASFSVGCLMFLWNLTIMSLFYSWRDDEDSRLRKWYNFLSNNATKLYMSSTSKNWLPGLLSTQMTMQALEWIQGAVEALGEIAGGDVKKQSKVNLNPIPRILREPDYFIADPYSLSEKTGVFNWMRTLSREKSGGKTIEETKAATEIDKLKKELKKNAKDKYLSVTQNGAIINKILENYVQEKFFPLETFGSPPKGNQTDNRHVKVLEAYEVFKKRFGDDFWAKDLRNGLRLREKLVINLLPFVKMQEREGLYNLRGEKIPDEDARHYISEEDLKDIYEIRFDEPMPNLDLKKVFKANPPEAAYEPEVKINEHTEIIK